VEGLVLDGWVRREGERTALGAETCPFLCSLARGRDKTARAPCRPHHLRMLPECNARFGFGWPAMVVVLASNWPTGWEICSMYAAFGPRSLCGLLGTRADSPVSIPFWLWDIGNMEKAGESFPCKEPRALGACGIGVLKVVGCPYKHRRGLLLRYIPYLTPGRLVTRRML